MTLTYSLYEHDFLQYHLFAASKSETIKKQKRKSFLMAVVAIAAICLLLYQNTNPNAMYLFFVFGGILLGFYPLYLKSHYKNYYQKFVSEAYKGRIGEIVTVTFKDEVIETTDKTGESKIYQSQIEDITETTEHFFIKLKTGGCLIIPKRGITDKETSQKELRILAKKLGIGYASENPATDNN